MESRDYGKRLRAVRKEKGLTQEMVAEQLDTSPSYLSDIERGVKSPSLSTFIRLLEILDVSADYILQGSLDSAKVYMYKDMQERLDYLTPKQRQFISDYIDLYIKSLE